MIRTQQSCVRIIYKGITRLVSKSLCKIFISAEPAKRGKKRLERAQREKKRKKH